jgi:hypothetical protein
MLSNPKSQSLSLKRPTIHLYLNFGRSFFPGLRSLSTLFSADHRVSDVQAINSRSSLDFTAENHEFYYIFSAHSSHVPPLFNFLQINNSDITWAESTQNRMRIQCLGWGSSTMSVYDWFMIGQARVRCLQAGKQQQSDSGESNFVMDFHPFQLPGWGGGFFHSEDTGAARVEL